MALVGDVAYRTSRGPHFSARTRVWIGGVECNIAGVALARLVTPSASVSTSPPPAPSPSPSSSSSRPPILDPMFTATSGGVPGVPSGAAASSGSGTLRLLSPLEAAVAKLPESGIVDVLIIESPRFADMCPNDTVCDGDAAYKSIIIANPVGMGSELNAGSVNGSLPAIVGGVLSCPPHCPGDADDFVSGGIYYVKNCTGFSTQPSVCLNPETADRCGFGSGDSCARCPHACLCPGGSRCW